MFGNMASVWASEMKMPSRQTTISVKNAGPIYMLNSSSTLHPRIFIVPLMTIFNHLGDSLSGLGPTLILQLSSQPSVCEPQVSLTFSDPSKTPETAKHDEQP